MEDTLPLWTALLLAAAEWTGLAAALAVAVRALWPAAAGQPRGGRWALPGLAALLVLLAGAAFSLRAGGTEPSITPDTVCEAQVVSRCLQGVCHTGGIGSSVPGVLHGSAWNHLHVLATWSGLSEQAFHLGLHLLFGVAVLLVALTGWSTGGALVGALAAVLTALFTGRMNIVLGMLYNHRGVSFAGALTTALLVVTATTGRTLPLVLAAVTAAVGTNMHLLCGTLGVAIGLVGLAAPGSPAARVRRTAVASLAFALTLFGTSPAAWISNVALLLSPARLGGGGAGAGAGADASTLLGYLVLAGLLVVGVVVRRVRVPALVGLAVIVPKMVFFELARRGGSIGGDDKYLVEAAPAAALVLAGLVGALLDRLGGLVEPLTRRGLALPLAGALALGALAVVPVRRSDLGIDGLPLYSVPDALALERHLRVERGWSPARTLAGFRASSEVSTASLLEYFAQLAPDPWRAAAATPTPAIPDGADVLALAVPDERLQPPLPASWRGLRSSEGRTLLLIEGPSWLDWTRLQYCVQTADGPETCVPTGFGREGRVNAEFPSRLEGMPYVDDVRSGKTRVRVRFPVRVPPAPAEHVLLAPHLRWRCGGTFVAVEGGASRLEADGRRAVLASGGPAPVEGTVTAEWRLGSDACPWVVNGLVPWLLEVDPDTARRLPDLLPEVDFGPD